MHGRRLFNKTNEARRHAEVDEGWQVEPSTDAREYAPQDEEAATPKRQRARLLITTELFGRPSDVMMRCTDIAIYIYICADRF